MSKIRDTFIKPSSGWWIVDPISKVEFRSNSYRNLRGQVMTHREVNKLPTEDVDQLIHDQVCSREPDAFCQAFPTHLIGDNGPPVPSILDMAVGFAKSVAFWAAQGFPIVAKEVFEERLRICQACPHFNAGKFWQNGKCNKCGCCTQIKPWMETGKCPDNPPRW